MLAAVPLAALTPAPADAQDVSSAPILQVFEASWQTVEERAVDAFYAGYGGLWLPPPGRADSGNQSVGYDVYDRFDLGSPRNPTLYGTQSGLKAAIGAARNAGMSVYTDLVINHNGFSDLGTVDTGNPLNPNDDVSFATAGGYPGFALTLPGDIDGDFHSGFATGDIEFRLSGLIDIAQEKNHQFIRHPVEAGNPDNIPAGTRPAFGRLANRPDPDNARFYPDQTLSPDIFVNPPSAHSGSDVTIRSRFNTAMPLAGDVVTEDSTGYLRRWLHWMLEVQRIDGYRLDASKHTFPWWWDTHFDSAVFGARWTPDGRRVTPFSFGENTTGNFDVLNNYYRKDEFADRDALDLNGAARLRELIGGSGLNSWSSLFADANGGHLDQADDGLQNGSAGVFHVFSHDNGSVGGGSSLPPIPTDKQQGWYAHAYMLMRPGLPIVYHNGRGVQRSFGFFPREGVPVALGWDPTDAEPEDAITRLVDLHNTLADGFYFQRNGNINDVLVFERASNPGGGLVGNVLVAANDRYDSGFDNVTVNTTFAQGTRLVEHTGNAADPDVDTTGQIPEVITVGANGSVTLRVPRNASTAGEHNRGYVVYAPAVPDSTLTIVGQDGVIPPDPPAFPDFLQRITETPIVTADTFTLRLETVPGDSVDLTTDDNALFRIDDGALDWNGSGGPDIPHTAESFRGYEQFTDTNAPGMDDPDREGLYEQVIDATRLSEGYHYISTAAFRQRPAGTGALFDEEREVVYVDRAVAEVDLLNDQPVFTDPQPTFNFGVDRTVEVLYAFLNLGPGDDPLSMLTAFNAARRFDRFEWRRTFDDELVPGENTVTLVGAEPSGRNGIIEFTVMYAPPCPADLAEPFGVLDLADITAFVDAFVNQQPPADLAEPFGVFDLADVSAFAAAFTAGCP